MEKIEIKQNFLRILVGYMLMIGVYWGFKYGIVPLINLPYAGSELTLITYVVLYGIGMPIFLFVTRKIKENRKEKNAKTITGKEIFNILVIQTGLSVFVLAVANFICKMIFSMEPEGNIEYSFTNFFILLVFAPIMEELFFRKILFDKLLVVDKRTSIIMSAVLFAIPHVLSQGIPQLFYTFVLGGIWAYVRYYYKDMRVVIGLHSFSNFWCGILPILLTKTMIGKGIYIILFLLVIPLLVVKAFLDIKKKKL